MAKITAERLDKWWQEFAVHGANTEEEDEIMRLALFGLWALNDAIPALAELKEICDDLEGAGSKVWHICANALGELPNGNV